jgi:hypothetical protein
MYRLRRHLPLSVLAGLLWIPLWTHGPPRPPPKAARLVGVVSSQPPQSPSGSASAGSLNIPTFHPRLIAPRPVVAHQTAAVAPQSPPASLPPPASSNAAIWACIRAHESGGNYADDTGNGYYGAYQFLQSTWDSIARRYDPALVGVRPSSTSPSTQDQMAIWLQETSGWGQWSTARECGA